MFSNKLYFSFFLIFIKFFNIKNHCFKTVSSNGSSSRSSARSYKSYNKKNPDIYVKKYKVYKKPKFYNSYRNYNPYYRYYNRYYNPYYSYYNSYYYGYYNNYYRLNPFPIHYYNSYINNDDYKYSQRAYSYRYNSYELMIFYILIILFILIILICIIYFFKNKSKEEVYVKESYNYNIYENIDFNNPNTINNIVNLYIPEILQIKVPDYDSVNYYIFNTRDDNYKIENPEVFLNILKSIENKNDYINNMEIILSPINIFFLHLPNVLNFMNHISGKINLHFAFVREFYENDFNEMELINILRDLCKNLENSSIKIIGYNLDEDKQAAFSYTLNNIFKNNLNMNKDLEKLQFVKIL